MRLPKSSAIEALQLSKAKRARRHLLGKGVTRDDSDDELGLDDHGWEWIYSSDDQIKRRIIIGARHGPYFQCMLGDCVLLKANIPNEAWVGIICEFNDNDENGEKEAYFMWFSTEKEIINKQKKRTDSVLNELYITPSWDWNPLTTINGKAKVVSLASYNSKYPAGRIPRGSPDFGKLFICRRGCNTNTATYTDEVIWEDIYQGDQDLEDLISRIKGETKATRKKRANFLKDEAGEWLDDDANELPSTPSKRQKTLGTPSKLKVEPRTPRKLTTPTHKRTVVKKPLEFTPLGTRVLSPGRTSSSPFQVARTRLHVSSIPTALPCREDAFATVYSHLEAAISDGSGSCIYISGTPGTGKTATVREVVAQLNTAVQRDELDDFIFVEINGMKVTDPHQSYSLLWEALHGDRVGPSHALDLLDREFSNPNPRRVPCVVLMDELDQLVTKNQSVMYNFFNWPGLRHSHLIVLAVANTMDLPERTLSNKISSRLGLTRITFPGYSHDQLIKIIQSRLEGIPGNIVDPDAVQFASRKVAAVSGDARRALDICRRAVEIAECEASNDEVAATPTRKRKASEVEQKKTGRVVIGTIKQAINEATSSPLQQYLKSLPLASKLFLAALLARTRRSGVPECVLGDVLDETTRLRQAADSSLIKDFLIQSNDSVIERGGQGSFILTRPLAMSAASIELVEAGIVGLEPRKGERTGKIRLNVGEDEIRLALKDDIELRGLGFS